nr:uncharacterized protein LOC111852240 [Paramormyrops kingsleyae]
MVYFATSFRTMAVHGGVLVLLLLLGCSCEAQQKMGFPAKTTQLLAGYLAKQGASQSAGFQSGLGAPQAVGFQSGLGAPQSAGFQSGLGAPQSAGFQSRLILTKQVAPSLVKSVTGMQVSPDGVSVVCGEDSVVVLVQPILLGNGQPINASDITFGGCAPIGQDASGTVRFQSALQACGSTVMMTADALVYSFALVYTPRGINGLPIVRTNGAMVGSECHYLR